MLLYLFVNIKKQFFNLSIFFYKIQLQNLKLTFNADTIATEISCFYLTKHRSIKILCNCKFKNTGPCINSCFPLLALDVLITRGTSSTKMLFFSFLLFSSRTSVDKQTLFLFLLSLQFLYTDITMHANTTNYYRQYDMLRHYLYLMIPYYNNINFSAS